MCNHYQRVRKKAEHMGQRGLFPFMDDLFSETRIKLFDNYSVRENVYPDGVAFVARRDETGAVVPDVMRWGFPPVQGRMVITNVRNIKSGFWKGWLKPEWRCLVPVSRFYEPKPNAGREEVAFERVDGEDFYFAGIWRPWTGLRGTRKAPVAGEHKLFAFLTTEPNAVVAPIHPKAMPVLLEPDQCEAWLAGADAAELQKPAADDMIRIVEMAKE